MQMTQLVRKLGRNDVKLIGRDRFLLFMFTFAAYIAIVLRYLLPWADRYLAESGILPSPTVALHFADLYPMVVAYMGIFVGAQIAGTITGFMLLDEKDDNTLRAMAVMPLPLQQYLLYRVLLPAVFGFMMIIVMVLVIAQAVIPIWQLLLIAAGGALGGPIVTLFFGTFAENKVQGFAMGKFVGIGGFMILAGWFVPTPWQWLFGVFPPFWVSKAYWMILAGEAGWWLVLLIGVVAQVATIAWLLRRFTATVYRK